MKQITSKQRAHLKSLAQTIDPIFQIGKSGVTPEITKAIDDALEAREIIKITVLDNCMLGANQVCEMLSERTHSIPVQVIGRKVVLYRMAKKQPKIQLPK